MAPHLNPLGIPVLDIGRDVNGQFRPGNKGGPGNPFARKVASLRKMLLDAVSEQDIKDIAQILKLKALQGDKAAIKLILQYCVGKPEPVKDPDRMDIDEWNRLTQMSVSDEEFEQTVESFPADLACHKAATNWPCNAQEGPLASDIRSIHSEMQEAGRHPIAPNPLDFSADEAQSVPRATQQESKPRRESTGAPRGRRSSAQPPSPNGESDEDQLRTIEQLQRAFQPFGQPEQPPTG